jgi:hypothetical protein
VPLEHVRRLDDVIIHTDEDEILALHGSLLAVGTATDIHPAAYGTYAWPDTGLVNESNWRTAARGPFRTVGGKRENVIL